MYSKALTLLSLGLCWNQALAISSHRSNPDAAIPAESAQGSSTPFGVIEIPRPVGPGRNDSGDLLELKAAKPSVGFISSRTREAYLFLTGPKLGSKEANAEAVTLTRDLVKLVQDKVALVQILSLPKFTSDSLQTALASLSFEEGASVNLTVVVNSEAMKSRKDLTFWTDEGEMREEEFTSLLNGIQKKLDITGVTFKKDRAVGKGRTNTVLLTSFAASAQCERYPASVFGITAANSWRYLKRIAQWIETTRKENILEFPTDAVGWWLSWEGSPLRSLASIGVSDYAEANSYWYCDKGWPEKIHRNEW